MYTFLQHRYLLILLIGLFFAPLRGEDAKALSLNKEQIIHLVLENNKSLAAAKTTVEQARARYRQAGKWDNPELSVSYSSDRAFNNEGESALGIAFEQSFPVTNKLRLLENIAQVEIELAEVEIINQERLLIAEVENALTEFSYVEQKLSIQRPLITLNQQLSDLIASRVETGEASSIELNQVKIELAAIEQVVLLLENERDEQLSVLKRLLGYEHDEEVLVHYELTLPKQFDELPFFTQEDVLEHPDYMLKKLIYQIATEQVSLAQADRWGDIAVEVFFESERGIDEPEGIGTDRFIGIGVSIPLPLNSRYNDTVEERRAYKRQLEKEMEATSLEIRSEAEFLRKKSATLYKQAVTYRDEVSQLVEQNLSDMNAAYNAGQVGLGELFRAQEQGLQIRLAHLSMLHDFNRAVAQWKVVTAHSIQK